MPLVFQLEAKLKSYGHFVFLAILNNFAKVGFSQSGHNFFVWHQNKKLRALYSMKLWKLDKVKCPQFFILRPNKKSMQIFSSQQFSINLPEFWSLQSGYIILIWPPNEKLRVLYFRKLQKFDGIKCPHFSFRIHLKKLLPLC